MSPAPVAETIVQPGETTVKSTMKRASVKSAMQAASVKSTTMKATPVKAAMKAAKSAPVKSPAAVGSSISEIWLAKRSSAEQSCCEDCQRFSHPRSGSSFC